MKILSLIIFGLLSTHAMADATPPSTDLQCHVMVFATDLTNGMAETEYAAPLSSGAHGGKDYAFKFQDHQVAVNSDGKWLNITWVHKGILVAMGTSVRSENVQNAAVMILYNPNNQDEQVSVNCEKQ
jgi:hypothetical protein